MAVKNLKLIIDDCPWCVGVKPAFKTWLAGHRAEPVRYVALYCPKCGAQRTIHATETESSEAWGYSMEHKVPHETALATLFTERLYLAWNRPKLRKKINHVQPHTS